MKTASGWHWDGHGGGTWVTLALGAAQGWPQGGHGDGARISVVLRRTMGSAWSGSGATPVPVWGRASLGASAGDGADVPAGQPGGRWPHH